MWYHGFIGPSFLVADFGSACNRDWRSKQHELQGKTKGNLSLLNVTPPGKVKVKLQFDFYCLGLFCFFVFISLHFGENNMFGARKSDLYLRFCCSGKWF